MTSSSPNPGAMAGHPDNATAGRHGSAEAVLVVEGLSTYFDTPGGVVKAVDDVSFEVSGQDILAIVGESGSGKSVTARSIMKLVETPPGRYVAGAIRLQSEDLLKLSERRMQDVRGKRISMIFQDPRGSLNPSFRIGYQIRETLKRHGMGISKEECEQRATELLRDVGFPDPGRVAASYPHEISGGMCQRVAVALSIACRPSLIIADEPTTAVDVLIQATILRLLRRLHREHSIPIIVITHDFGVVRAVATRVVVMYAGKVQEQGSVESVLERPQHPYTKALIASVPRARTFGGELYQISGQPPDLSSLPPGCTFADRCEYAWDLCRAKEPPLYRTATDALARCHLHEGSPRSNHGSS